MSRLWPEQFFCFMKPSASVLARSPPSMSPVASPVMHPKAFHHCFGHQELLQRFCKACQASPDSSQIQLHGLDDMEARSARFCHS